MLSADELIETATMDKRLVSLLNLCKSGNIFEQEDEELKSLIKTTFFPREKRSGTILVNLPRVKLKKRLSVSLTHSVILILMEQPVEQQPEPVNFQLHNKSDFEILILWRYAYND